MAQLYSVTQLLLGANPTVVVLGAPCRFYLSVAVDTTAGTPTGTSVSVTVNGPFPQESLTCLYGTKVGKWFYGHTIILSGNGATIEAYADSRNAIDVTPQQIATAVIPGTVSTAIVSPVTTPHGYVETYAEENP